MLNKGVFRCYPGFLAPAGPQVGAGINVGLVLAMLLVWSLVASSKALAAAPLDPCRQGELPLMPSIELLEDPDRSLNASTVADLPASNFSSVTGRRFPLEFSASAIWLRFSLQAADTGCMRWLKVGEPRLDNVQVFLLRSGQWSEMRAGSNYPLSQWRIASRQPLFPLNVARGEHVQVVVRVQTNTVLMVDPVLWDNAQQQRVLTRANLLDGVSMGIALAIVPFGFVISLIRRSRLLLMNSLAILAYSLVCSVVNGYLFYLPELLPWKQYLASFFSCFGFASFFGYLWVLFGVRVLPPWMKLLLIGFTLLMSGLLLWGAFGDYRATRDLFSQWRWFTYVLVPLMLAAIWFYGKRPSWLAFGLTVLFTFQGIARHLVDVKNVGWQYGEDQLGLTSTLPGVLLLVLTLVLEFRSGRSRERQALADLDEQRRAEHERLESSVALRTEQLRESLRARSMLLAHISHDLRSPLTSIIEHARALGSENPGDTPRHIERNARRQLEMIDELLEFSRSELQQLELVLAPGYLYGFLREIEDEGCFLALRQDNRFKCVFAADLPALVQADFRRLRQVLINLIANAGKFTRNGFIEFSVERLDQDECSAQIRFCVKDSGIGFRSEEREALLQPFQRGSNAAGYDGSGLGLSIVSQLLQQMGSELQLEPARARGAALSFVLKMTCATEDQIESVLSDNHSPGINGEGRCILVVDDIRQNRDGLCDLLGGYGFDVLTAENGEQAVGILQGAQVDLLISDQMMAPMNGWDLLAWVRQHQRDLPVLLYSAAPPLRPQAVPIELTFDAALLKPAQSGELLAIVRTLVGPGSSGG